MSIFNAIKMFSDKTVKITCPGCAYMTEQSKQKLRKNITLVCPKCGFLFLPKDK